MPSAIPMLQIYGVGANGQQSLPWWPKRGKYAKEREDIYYNHQERSMTMEKVDLSVIMRVMCIIEKEKMIRKRMIKRKKKITKMEILGDIVGSSEDSIKYIGKCKEERDFVVGVTRDE